MHASGKRRLPAEQHLLLWSVGRLKPSEAVLIDVSYHYSPTSHSSRSVNSPANSVAGELGTNLQRRDEAAGRLYCLVNFPAPSNQLCRRPFSSVLSSFVSYASSGGHGLSLAQAEGA
jgi:hypothetical protein